MDLSFALRQRRRTEPQYAQLLAQSSAAQAMSPTARAQAALAVQPHAIDAQTARIDLLSGAVRAGTPLPASFGRDLNMILTARQAE